MAAVRYTGIRSVSCRGGEWDYGVVRGLSGATAAGRLLHPDKVETRVSIARAEVIRQGSETAASRIMGRLIPDAGALTCVPLGQVKVLYGRIVVRLGRGA